MKLLNEEQKVSDRQMNKMNQSISERTASIAFEAGLSAPIRPQIENKVYISKKI